MDEMGEFSISYPLSTPILFITFKRPDTTIKVFEEIRKVKPKKLYLAQNYPSGKNFEDTEKWKKVRLIIENVDWDCEVKRLYRDHYFEVKISVSSAIDWFFSHVEEGIILEDDCVPDQSFFPFCQELLERYRNDTRIMMISGDNFQFGKRRTDCSYYFSRYAHIWGWATWKRAWNHYDVSMKMWPKIHDGGWLNAILDSSDAVKYWTGCFEDTYTGKINTWDYQWVFTCWIQGGLSLMPEQNLITNIGFDPSSTHTAANSIFSKLPFESIKFPLQHPGFVIRNIEADRFTEKIWYSHARSLKSRLWSALTMLKNKLA
jgi:hypothetical protein